MIFSPSGLVADVKSLWRAGKRLPEGHPGDVVSVALGGVASQELRRGMVASSSSEAAADAESFVAQVVLFELPGQVRAGYCPSIAVHSCQADTKTTRTWLENDGKGGEKDEKT